MLAPVTQTDLIPTREVAARKGVTVKTVNLWAQQGLLPVAEVERVSGARLFDPNVVAAFVPPSAPAASPHEAAGVPEAVAS